MPEFATTRDTAKRGLQQRENSGKEAPVEASPLPTGGEAVGGLRKPKLSLHSNNISHRRTQKNFLPRLNCCNVTTTGKYLST